MTGSKDILCEMGMSVDQEHSKSLILKVPIFFFFSSEFLVEPMYIHWEIVPNSVSFPRR